jgi:BirA family biotin operon repressor/biotin-[acetyl-CoA-carboxylase] ligase
MDATAELSELEAAVRVLPGGWTGTFLAQTASTQDVARLAAADGAPHRSVFVADVQTAGRGRHSRRWLAPAGTALLLSMLLRQRADAVLPWRATILASVAMAEAVERVAPTLHVQIKWPNDLVLGDRKLAGILAEARSRGDEQTTIVGIGVNVSMDAATLEPLGLNATSLLLATGQHISRARLLRSFLERFDDWLAQPHEAAHTAWQARLWRRHQRIRLADGDTLIEGVVLGADADGALSLRLADGSVQRTFTAELLW